MKKILALTLATLALAACANTAGSGNTQVYGEMKSGVEVAKQGVSFAILLHDTACLNAIEPV